MSRPSDPWRLLILSSDEPDPGMSSLLSTADGWEIRHLALSAADPSELDADLLWLDLPPSHDPLRAWLPRFRLLHPNCPVHILEGDESPRWYRDAIHLGVDEVLPRVDETRDWEPTLREIEGGLSTGAEQSRLLGRLERQNRSLDQSRRSLAEMLLKAYENLGRVHRQLGRRMDQMSTLYELGRDLTQMTNWNHALDRFLNTCVENLDFNGVALLLWSFDGQRLATRCSLSLTDPGLEEAIAVLKATDPLQRSRMELMALAEGRLHAGTALLESPPEWDLYLLPLVHEGEAQGYLVYRKPYCSPGALESDADFLKTVQIILSEEIAHGKTIQRLKRLEKFNRSVLEGVRAAVVALDGFQRVSYRNPQAARLFGSRLALGSALTFDGTFHFTDGGSNDLASHDWIHRECTLRSPDEDDEGEERLLLISTTRLPVRHKTQAQYVMVCEDITDYRRLQGELRRVEHLSKLGQLSAGMAHEIRNPLAGIAMTAQVLRGKLKDSQDAYPFLDRIQEETERLERIVRSLLDYSRPVSPKLVNVDLRESAQRALGDMAPQAATAGLTLAGPDAAEPLHAWADRDQLQQVLLNLLLNAIQACRAGDRVGLRLERAAVAGGGADRPRLVVYDSGPGVEEAVAERLFDPFFTTKAEGTGLGLSVCQKIMEEHGGQIRYRQGQEGGAEFVLELTPAPQTLHRRGDPT